MRQVGNWTLKPVDINNISWNYGVPATCGAGFEFQAISGCYDDIAELRGEIGSRSPKFAAIDSGVERKLMNSSHVDFQSSLFELRGVT